MMPIHPPTASKYNALRQTLTEYRLPDQLRGHLDPETGPAVSRVLVVDDEQGIRKTLETLLKIGGFEVITAEDGAAALAALQGHQFDLIISDISMPNLGGVELLEKVRDRDPDLPVVLLTGLPSMETAIRAVELGASKYIMKPIDAKDMLNTAKEAAAKYRATRVSQYSWRQASENGIEVVDPTAMERELEVALDGLIMAYQPLVSAQSEEVIGYEALMRPQHANLSNPPALLKAAERVGRLTDVGRRVRELAPQTFAARSNRGLLFVNLHPAELQDPELLSAHAPLTAMADRVVLEITERRGLEKLPNTERIVAELRERGFRIAVDDLGSGYSGLNNFAVLQPEFVKLDMTLIRGIDTDNLRQKLVSSLSNTCSELGIFVVAEGVETAAERDAVAALGVDLFQGYYFGRPGPLA